MPLSALLEGFRVLLYAVKHYICVIISLPYIFIIKINLDQEMAPNQSCIRGRLQRGLTAAGICVRTPGFNWNIIVYFKTNWLETKVDLFQTIFKSH